MQELMPRFYIFFPAGQQGTYRYNLLRDLFAAA